MTSAANGRLRQACESAQIWARSSPLVGNVANVPIGAEAFRMRANAYRNSESERRYEVLMQMVNVVKPKSGRTSLSFVRAWFLDGERSQRHFLPGSVMEHCEQGSGELGGGICQRFGPCSTGSTDPELAF